MSLPPPAPAGGRLADNLVHFGRLLRGAGLPIGPGRVLEALHAVEAVGIEHRDDFYWALHAVFVARRDQHDLFDQAFGLFWRDPGAFDPVIASLLPTIEAPHRRREPPLSRRLAEAYTRHRPTEPVRREPEEVQLDAALTWSAREVLGAKDFEQMSAAETREAERIVAGFRLPVRDLPTRRFRPHPRGERVDPRATLKASVRAWGADIPLRWRTMRRRPPALVALCDISGSMTRYSRMLLCFLHAVTSDRDRVHSFVFGTRLTNITRYLRRGDADMALGRVGRAVQDWAGGTRIGACLEEFNLRWSRRVLGQGAVVLLITDGLDRDDAHGLDAQMRRLHRSCRRLIWLNPLLRYQGFEPLAAGIQAMLPHVDDFRPVHNLRSLADLVAALAGGRAGRRSR